MTRLLVAALLVLAFVACFHIEPACGSVLKPEYVCDKYPDRAINPGVHWK